MPGKNTVTLSLEDQKETIDNYWGKMYIKSVQTYSGKIILLTVPTLITASNNVTDTPYVLRSSLVYGTSTVSGTPRLKKKMNIKNRKLETRILQYMKRRPSTCILFCHENLRA